MTAIALAVAVAGCSSRSQSGGVVPSPSAATRSVVAQAAAHRVAVTVAGGCPETLGHAGDVANDPAELRHHLLLVGPHPSAGLVCEYRDRQHGGQASTQLTRSVPLDAGRAARLTSVIARVALARPRGAFHCPAAMFGTDTVIAFTYPGRRTVDLWYYTSGCRTLDNGYVRAYQAGNRSFYAAFESAFASAMRR
jgi:hypothetical protein